MSLSLSFLSRDVGIGTPWDGERLVLSRYTVKALDLHWPLGEQIPKQHAATGHTLSPADLGLSGTHKDHQVLPVFSVLCMNKSSLTPGCW